MPKDKRASNHNVRSRGWCYTINNPSSDEVTAIKQTACRYHIFGRETGAEGTPHLQGFIYFKHPRSFTATKKVLPRAHIEIAVGTPEQASAYCRKQDPNFFVTGTLPLSPKQKGEAEQDRWMNIKKFAMEGLLEEIESKVFVQNYRSLKQISVDYQTAPPSLDAPVGVWLYGESGAGKTTFARALHPAPFLKSPTKWWDSYRQKDHPVVILDDLDPYHKALGYHVKMWADKWSFVAEVKGSSLTIRPKLFVITSQYLPEAIWDDHQTVQAVRRRFKIFEVESSKKISELEYPLILGYTGPATKRDWNPEVFQEKYGVHSQTSSLPSSSSIDPAEAETDIDLQEEGPVPE